MSSPYTLEPHMSWNGARVLSATMPAVEVSKYLPTFSRMPFGNGDNVNNYLEVISRDPFGGDKRLIPVATVSKRYALLQHTELISKVVKALEGLKGTGGLPLDVSPGDEAKVVLSEFGERLECSVYFKRVAVDPGDGHPISLRLFLRNSVDGSCAFEVSLRWFRQVCSNGMCVLTKQDRLRAIHHLDRINPTEFQNFLKSRLPVSLEHASLFNQWLGIRVTEDDLRKWIQMDVSKAWGPHAAARVLHVCMSGYDGRVGGTAGKKVRTDELFVSSDSAVPGAIVPAKCLYHVYQALTWVAERRTNIEERENWSNSTLALTRTLAKKLKPP